MIFTEIRRVVPDFGVKAKEALRPASLRGAFQLKEVASGGFHLGEESVHEIPTRELARRLGLLPQTPVARTGSSSGNWLREGARPARTGPW